MKRTVLALILTVFAISMCGCAQIAAKSFGGDITLTLDKGQKLEEITWKDDELWYVTRPMREDEHAETHTFQESSVWGVMEGSVTVVEVE